MNNTNNNPLTLFGKYAFFIFIVGVSLMMSFGFGVTFLPEALPAFFGRYRDDIMGVIVALLLDGSALTWQWVRVNVSRSSAQMNIATGMSRLTIGSAVAITATQLVMVGYGFEVSNAVRDVVGYAGLTIIIIVFCLSFVAVWSFVEHDPDVKRKALLLDETNAQMEQATVARVEALRRQASSNVRTIADAHKDDDLRTVTGSAKRKRAKRNDTTRTERNVSPERNDTTRHADAVTVMAVNVPVTPPATRKAERRKCGYSKCDVTVVGRRRYCSDSHKQRYHREVAKAKKAGE